MAVNKLKNQIRKLYTSSILGSLSLTGAWVAILAARGFSLVEIGLAEGDRPIELAMRPDVKTEDGFYRIGETEVR